MILALLSGTKGLAHAAVPLFSELGAHKTLGHFTDQAHGVQLGLGQGSVCRMRGLRGNL